MAVAVGCWLRLLFAVAVLSTSSVGAPFGDDNKASHFRLSPTAAPQFEGDNRAAARALLVGSVASSPSADS